MAKIPVVAAKRLARAYKLDQVIIIGIDRKIAHRYHATYGNDKFLCDDAANASRMIDLVLTSKTPEEFLLKAKIGWRTPNDKEKAEALHGVSNSVADIGVPNHFDRKFDESNKLPNDK